MANTLAVTYGTGINATASSVSNSLGNVQEAVNVLPGLTFTYGTGNSQAQVLYSAKLPLVVSTTYIIDLTALATGLGTQAMSKLKLIHLANLDLTTSVTVGGGTNGFAACFPATETLPPLGIIFKSCPKAGWTVDGTHKLLRLDPGAATATVQVIAIGLL